MAVSRDVTLEIQIFFSPQASRGHFPHKGWKILGRAKCETARLDQYIWRNLVAWFPTRRLFDAGHLKLVGLGQFVFPLHPRTDFRGQRESSFFSYSCRRETGRPLEDSEQCYPQFSSLRSSRKVALDGTRTLYWMIHTVFNLSRVSTKDAFLSPAIFHSINNKMLINYIKKK